MNEAAQTDWANSRKLDLTDAGLLRDLDKRSETAGGAQLLGRGFLKIRRIDPEHFLRRAIVLV
jgi:hypothetical protein